MQRKRFVGRVGLIGGILLAAVAAIMAIATGSAHPGVGLSAPASLSASDYDLLAMLRELQRTNADIHTVNDRILTVLRDVEQQAARVGSVRGRLVGMEEGLQQQQGSLDRLLSLTAKQAELSRTMRDLTARVVPSTVSLARTASAQSDAVQQMSLTTARMAAHLLEIEAANRATAAKLERAESLSALVLTRMP